METFAMTYPVEFTVCFVAGVAWFCWVFYLGAKY